MPGIAQINKTISSELPEGSTVQGERWLTKMLGDFLEQPERPRKGSGKAFHASQIGNPCDRFLYLHYHGMLPRESIPAQLRRIFDHGHATEDRYLRYFQKMEILREREVPARIEDPPIHGRADFILVEKDPDPKLVILELKTINNFGFDKLKGPDLKHEMQLQVYLNILGQRYGTLRGIVWYECKNDQRVKAYRVDRDEKLWAKMVERCNRVLAMDKIPEVTLGKKHSKYCPCLHVEEESTSEK
jgi:hypothetical protein